MSNLTGYVEDGKRFTYDDLPKTAGIGRDRLERRLAYASRELKTLHDNLTSTQRRCTELLEDKRALIGLLPKGPEPAMISEAFLEMFREWDPAERAAFVAALKEANNGIW